VKIPEPIIPPATNEMTVINPSCLGEEVLFKRKTELSGNTYFGSKQDN
jgi:hypothetical protein